MPRISAASLTPAAKPEVLIATLGMASQVGTLTFDELFFKREIPLRHVVWVHTSEAGDMKIPLERVRREVENYYAEKCPDVTFEFVAIEGRDGHRPLDTKSRADAEAVMFTLHKLLRDWKERGYTLHLSISGGRKVISAFGVAAAQLCFDSEADKCWHLMSEDLLANRELMHAEPQHEVILIPVPILLWDRWKGLTHRTLAEAIAQDPLHAQEISAQLDEAEILRWRRRFVDSLSSQDASILEAIALYGWENEEIDKNLFCSCKNVVTRIWREYFFFCLNNRIGGPVDERLRRGQLIADFHMVFQARMRERKARS